MAGLCLAILAGWMVQDPSEPGGKQDKKAQQKGPYGLPSADELKEKLKLSQDQYKKLVALFKEVQPKKGEGEPKEGGGDPGARQGGEGGMKKDNSDFKAKHDELVEKIIAFLNEEQKAAFKKLLEQLKKDMQKKGQKPGDGK